MIQIQFQMNTLGIKCIVTYNSEQDGLRPLLWYITFEDDTDEYAIVEALYNNALSNDKNDNGVLSSQDIEKIILSKE